MKHLPCTLSHPLTHTDTIQYANAIADHVWKRASTMTAEEKAYWLERYKESREHPTGGSTSGAPIHLAL